MHRASQVIRLAAATATVLVLAPTVAAGQNPDQPTFVDDVAPILHANCVSCHHPDEIGPMWLRTYREVRPWARSIARVVEHRDMIATTIRKAAIYPNLRPPASRS